MEDKDLQRTVASLIEETATLFHKLADLTRAFLALRQAAQTSCPDFVVLQERYLENLKASEYASDLSPAMNGLVAMTARLREEISPKVPHQEHP
jgi:hypothetical protein